MNLRPTEYFTRMTIVPEIGIEGLERLRSAHVTIVGVGGVGSAAAYSLGQTGVGHLRLIDQDVVEPSNLHRLHGADKSSLYQPKAEVMAEILPSHSPWTEVEPVIDTLRLSNADELLSGSDVVVDGLDNFRTRYLLNQFSYETGTPYLFASAVRSQGHIGLFHPPETACLECALPSVVDRPEESCETLGVTPTITGLVGVLAASEVTKVLLRNRTRLMGQLLTIDTVTLDFIISTVPRRMECRICGGARIRQEIRDTEALTTLCGGKTANVIPESTLTLDLNRFANWIPDKDVLTNSSTVLVFRRGAQIVSLFRTGRMLIEGVDGSKEARRVAMEIWSKATGQLAHSA